MLLRCLLLALARLWVLLVLLQPLARLALQALVWGPLWQLAPQRLVLGWALQLARVLQRQRLALQASLPRAQQLVLLQGWPRWSHRLVQAQPVVLLSPWHVRAQLRGLMV